jgi:VWFA-related protein
MGIGVRRTFYLATTMLVGLRIGWAQGTETLKQNAPQTLRSTSTLVIVPTLVKGASGELIPGLVASDFRVTDNGVEQTVTVEDVERQPLSMVVLLQTGSAGSRQLQNYRNLGTMLEYMMGSSAYEIAMNTFDSQTERSWGFTSNLDHLKDGFQHPVEGDDGAAIVDAVSEGIDLLKKRPATSRRVILLFSQPYDDGSKAKAEDVVKRLGENNITIYSITFSPEKAWLKDQFTKPRHENAPYQLTPNEPPLLHTFDLATPLIVAIKAMKTDTAAEIASLSGGEHLRFDEKRNLESKLGMLANHIPNRYTLSFRSSSDAPGFHEIKVSIVNHPEVAEVDARTSYWSERTTGVEPEAK